MKHKTIYIYLKMQCIRKSPVFKNSMPRFLFFRMDKLILPQAYVFRYKLSRKSNSKGSISYDEIILIYSSKLKYFHDHSLQVSSRYRGWRSSLLKLCGYCFSVLWITLASLSNTSTNRLEYPNSLSYQPTTLTNPPTMEVNSESNTQE